MYVLSEEEGLVLRAVEAFNDIEPVRTSRELESPVVTVVTAGRL